jgi:D-glycero-D-manno-heptose 1,7-bisphosphate phosphatase
MNKAVFFDRDGVINERIKGGYVRNWDEFVLSPDLPSFLKQVKAKGYLAIIITNQRGVGKGLMSEKDLAGLHDKLQSTLVADHGLSFDDIYYCTDLSDDSTRRKPSPAMLLEAATKWDIDLSQSWMIGDSISDIVAGSKAGAQTAYLVTKHTEQIPDRTVVLHSLTDLLPLL